MNPFEPVGLDTDEPVGAVPHEPVSDGPDEPVGVDPDVFVAVDPSVPVEIYIYIPVRISITTFRPRHRIAFVFCWGSRMTELSLIQLNGCLRKDKLERERWVLSRGAIISVGLPYNSGASSLNPLCHRII